MVEAAAAGLMNEEDALVADLDSLEIKVDHSGEVGVEAEGHLASRTRGRVSQSTRKKTPLRGGDEHPAIEEPSGRKPSTLGAELDSLQLTTDGSGSDAGSAAPALPHRSKTLTMSANGEMEVVRLDGPAPDNEPDYATVSTLIYGSGEATHTPPSAATEPTYETQAPSFLQPSATDPTHAIIGRQARGKKKSTRPTPYRPQEPKADFSKSAAVNNSAQTPQKSDVKLTTFLNGLGLLGRCATLSEDAGIVHPDDFLLFTKVRHAWQFVSRRWSVCLIPVLVQ